MDLFKIISIINDDGIEKKLYFSRKMKDQYITYSPEVDNKVFADLFINITDYLESFAFKERAMFSPIGKKDEVIELCSCDYVGNFQEVIESFDDGYIEDIENQADNFTFYCIKIVDKKENEIFLFRRVTKFKSLYSRGVLACFQGNKLNKVESKILGIDGYVDLVTCNGEILILNHVALERIFRLNEEFSRKAQEAMNKIRKSNKIANFDEFEEECMRNKNTQKILTKMLSEGWKLEACLKNFDNVKKTIDMFDLEIEVQGPPNEQIIYENKAQVTNILRFIRDSYYKSTINEQLGIDDKITN